MIVPDPMRGVWIAVALGLVLWAAFGLGIYLGINGGL